MKVICKIIFVLLIVLLIFSIKVSAFEGNPFDHARNFIETGSEYTGMFDENPKLMGILGLDMKKDFSELIGFIWGLGLLTVFVSTIILGIKYMLSNPDEKSRVKQATTPYIVGVIIIFGAVSIWQLMIIVLEGSI